MKSFKDRYPELVQFCAGYFNQDWKDLLPEGYERTTSGVLKEAFEQHNHSQLLELQRIFRDFLRETSTLDDEMLGKILLHELGAYYYAPWDGSTYHSWLA